MMSKKNSRRALLSSALALLLCVSMLVGSTFAWFTDEVTSANNIIKSGTLDVEMHWADGKEAPDAATWTDASTGAIFDYDKWEPGYTEVRHVKIANVGTLALKYALNIIPTGEVSKLADVIDVYFVDPAAQIADRTALKDENKIGTLTEVLAGMAVTANGTLKAGEGLTVTLALKMQEEAGNEYQDLEIGSDFAVQLLATQLTYEEDSFGNDYDEDSKYPGQAGTAGELNEALKQGGSIELVSDTDAGEIVAVPEDVSADLNLNGYTLNNTLQNYGDVVLSNGTIDVDFAGFENFGTATLENVTMNAGTANDYAAISNAGSETTYTNVDIASAGGGVAAVDGAKVTFNSGNVAVNSASTSGRYVFYVEGEGTELTINGGTFSFSKTQNQKRAYIYAEKGTTVYVNGGNFGPASTRSGYTAGIMGEGTVIITGGTFGFNPTKWVAAGYTAVKINGTWTVLKGDVGVTTADELQAALDNATGSQTIALAADITGDVTVTQKPDVKITIDGNGYTFSGVLTVDGQSKRYETAGLTIQNVNFNAETLNADAYIRLGHVNAARYTNNVTVKDCTFSGSGFVAVKSYTGGDWNVKLENLTVNAGMHSLAQMKNVEKGLEVTGCKVYSKNGLNVNNSLSLEMDGCTFDVQGYAVRFGSDANTTDESFAIANSTLKSACAESGDAVIEFRAGAVNATLTLTNTTLDGTVQYKGNTDATTITIVNN